MTDTDKPKMTPREVEQKLNAEGERRMLAEQSQKVEALRQASVLKPATELVSQNTQEMLAGAERAEQEEAQLLQALEREILGEQQSSNGLKPLELSSTASNTRSTGAMRESIGTKIDTTLVPYELILAAAVGLNHGKVRYAARNWEKGLTDVDLLMSIERHLRALMDGEVIDSRSGIPHVCLLASSVAMYTASHDREIMLNELAEPVERGQNIADLAEKYQQYLDAGPELRRQLGEA